MYHKRNEKESKTGSEIIDRFKDTLRIQMLSIQQQHVGYTYIIFLRIFLVIMIAMTVLCCIVGSQTRLFKIPVHIFFSSLNTDFAGAFALICWLVGYFLFFLSCVQMYFAIGCRFRALFTPPSFLSYYHLISNLTLGHFFCCCCGFVFNSRQSSRERNEYRKPAQIKSIKLRKRKSREKKGTRKSPL